eukprot:5709320-Lingulodinium_polyedra.AAC.1
MEYFIRIYLAQDSDRYQYTKSDLIGAFVPHKILDLVDKLPVQRPARERLQALLAMEPRLQ